MSDTITILRCARGLRLAKLIRAGETISYDSARTYDGWTVLVSGLPDIETLLEKIIHQPRLCVVRGKLIGRAQVQGIRRLLHRDPRTGDEPSLIDVSRQWVALDIEGIHRPAKKPADDLEGCARDVLRHLPAAFRRAACIVQATAGHGIKPDHRLRLWYWLSRPTSGNELKRWLRGCPADPSLFRAAQVCYTAAPVFDGCEDHLPRRLAKLAGDEVVQVPAPEKLAPPAPRAEKPIPGPNVPGASAYAQAVLRNAGIRVSRASVDRRHPTCLAQSRHLARFVSAGVLTASDVVQTMGVALQQAGKTKEEGEAIAAWALAHNGGDRP